MQVTMKVDYHNGTGRRTLKIRTQNEMMFSDCKGALFSNDDDGLFYRAVAALLHKHHVAGDIVDYIDTNLDLVRSN
jgi:hypothetical protein